MSHATLGRHIPTPAIAAAILVVGLVAVAALFVVDGPSPMQRAQHELDDDSSFTRGSDAGLAFTRASAHLQAAAERCGDDSHCARLFTAAAFLRVAALDALDCRRPELFEMRAALAAYIDALADGADPIPPATSC